MAEMPNSDPLPPATAHMLRALEAFLDTPPLPCMFRCIFCHNIIAWGNNFIQIRQSAYHPVIREGQFVLTCGGDVGIEVVFPM
ncbi:hypothetical protein PVL29_019409 [Vitis rotundifolia]|uniref:Yippee domain-containing protein n=1 Tax=Vitis rotundifolia TaxID=103349 RepID=A0AA38Z108_VITRO|nr:hypothetical protein PVL29_019409 [Vitis rotundifolia]